MKNRKTEINENKRKWRKMDQMKREMKNGMNEKKKKMWRKKRRWKRKNEWKSGMNENKIKWDETYKEGMIKNERRDEWWERWMKNGMNKNKIKETQMKRKKIWKWRKSKWMKIKENEGRYKWRESNWKKNEMSENKK